MSHHNAHGDGHRASASGGDANIHPDMHDAMIAGGMDGQIHVETRLIASLRCPGTFHNIIVGDANKRLYMPGLWIWANTRSNKII